MNENIQLDSQEAFALSHDATRELIIASFFGHISLNQLLDCYSAILQMPEFTRNINACFDFGAAIVEIDLKETENFYHFASGLREKRGENYELAMVYGDPMTKMLLDFYKLFLVRTQVHVGVFDTRERALAWLEQQAPADLHRLAPDAK